MTKVGIIGATGYAGAELVRILAGHPDVELAVITSRQYGGTAIHDLYPSLRGVVDLVCVPYAPTVTLEQAEIWFLALPHKLPMTLVPDLLAAGKRVIDLSADFRFQNQAAYEAHYQPHTAADLLPAAVYGLSEVYADQIRQSNLVGNPGCYPTSVLLPLIPLVKNGLVDTATLIADAKSGVSGAGRSASLTTHFCQVSESFKAYKVAAHRHNPEMEEILSHQAGTTVKITFVPHLVPMSRGMQTTQYARLTSGVGEGDLRACLTEYYAQSAFVRTLPAGQVADSANVRGTNFCDIAIFVDAHTGRVVLLSAIDNLVKGAAGQAVQNMNLMLGLSETAGLLPVPFPI
ncbi:MAG: N-acetyl-gamma-glutamyl-phosphate reductase [Desulfosarcinaceae bacterium]|nr:N-acetyl-gamma-glutamyl-phosphate reductase [Desulfosarcinaceae bacterium]